MRSAIALSLLTASFAPLTAIAAVSPWDQLEKDMKAYEDQVEFDSTLQQADEEEEWFTSQKELFPHVGEEEDTPLPPAADAILTVQFGANVQRYSDVPLSAWFAPYVRDVLEKGIMSGYKDAAGKVLGLYGPADNVTIEQLAKIAVQISGVQEEACTVELLNAPAKGRWSEHVIRCAENKGWAVYSDGSVSLTRPATRAEVIVTLLQAFSVQMDERKGTVFTDVTSSTEFGAAIETAAADHIVSGYNDANGIPTGMFGPLDSVKRAEIAKMVSLALQVYTK